MAKKNTSNISGDYNIYTDKLQKDLTMFGLDEKQWSYARNATIFSPRGDYGNLSNEQSNNLSITITYYDQEDFKHKNSNIKIIGCIHIKNDQWAVFSTDNINSEIGVFESDKVIYTKYVRSEKLNFSTYHLITGVGRMNNKCGRRVYWDDGINPSRVIDLDDIPWTKTCTTDDNCRSCSDNVDDIDIDKLRLATLVKPIALTMKKGSTDGRLINGSYFAVAAYVVEGERICDYSLPSYPVVLFNHEGLNGSLEVHIESIEEEEVDEYELVIYQVANGNNVAKKVGTYPTRQKTVIIDVLNEELPDVELGSIYRGNPIIDKSDAIYRNGPYLLRVGPTNKLDFNYQPLANQISTEWVVTEYPQDYYRDGGTNVGYLRDEVYSFFIRWVYNTGDKSRAYHIPGRFKENNDQTNDNDSVEFFDYEIEEGYEKWECKNTATVEERELSIAEDGIGVILGSGKMAYWQSTEKYDDDKPEVWNVTGVFENGLTKQEQDEIYKYNLCGKNIRHHKFPNNDTDTSEFSITNHYFHKLHKVVDGAIEIVDEPSIRIMGVRFSNIKPPLDNDGNIIDNIIGYEIMRGTREGNKSIVAKGMINNMREYKSTTDSDRTYLYPNYPYNATNSFKKIVKSKDSPIPDIGLDHFLSSEYTEYNKTTGQFGAYALNDMPLGADVSKYKQSNVMEGNIRKDYFTFHSPETDFRDPYLEAKEIDINGVMSGNMEAFFQVPHNFPKQKLLTNSSFVISILLGIGYAIIKMLGQSKKTSWSPQINYGGTTSGVGVVYANTGLFGAGAMPSATMTGGVTGYNVANTLMQKLLNSGGFKVLSLGTGQNPSQMADAMNNFMSTLSGALGGAGGQTSVETTDTAWTAIPKLLKKTGSLPMLANYWSQGIDTSMDDIYSWLPYKDYALQQVSHGFYNKFYTVKDGYKRRSIKKQGYINPTIQDVNENTRVNNLYRSRAVALQLDKALGFTQVSSDAKPDNSQFTLTEVSASSEYIDPTKRQTIYNRDIASYYVSMKQRMRNQYGQLHSIIIIPASYKSYEAPTETKTATSGVIFGGDTYIGRYTSKNTMPIFYDWQNGEPNGTEYDYRFRQNIPHPRFWYDSNKFDVSEFIQSITSIFSGSNNNSDFDVFMVKPSILQETIITYDKNGEVIKEEENPEFNENAICAFDDEHPEYENNCYFKEFDSKKWKALKEAYNDLIAAKADLEYIEAAACFYHTGIHKSKYEDDCDACNSNREITDINEYIAEEYVGKQSSWGKKIVKKFSASKFAKKLDKYNCDDKGAVKHKINHAQRKIKRKQRQYNRKEEKLHKLYEKKLTSGDSKGLLNWIRQKVAMPTDRYSLDMWRKFGKLQFIAKDAYMYLFVSGIRDFFVESSLNIDFRDYGKERGERHYDHLEFTDLKELFHMDNIKIGNYMKIDTFLSVGRCFSNFNRWEVMQRTDYDPSLAESCYKYQPRKVFYSLPQMAEETRRDNWKIFLPKNYKVFTSKPIAIKEFGKLGAIIVFESESPVYFQGVDQLNTDAGLKLNLGDGGLFSNFPLQMSQSDLAHEYGSCQDRLSVINTPTGVYFIGQNQGKIFQANSGSALMEVSQSGLTSWFARYLPYKLTKSKVFNNKDFELINNPVTGIGCQSVYDNENHIMYFSKKDYVIKSDKEDLIEYVGNDVFKLKGRNFTIKLGDSNYFDDASWTISYNPETKYGSFISYHDWHQDMSIPSKDTFFTTKNNQIWEHNKNSQSFCNFYGIDYPFEIEFPISSDGANVETLKNVYYVMEAYIYEDNGDDRFHVLDGNFDRAIVYNTEQCSGELHLNIRPKNDPIESSKYPYISNDSAEIICEKEEQIYKFNQFFDLTNNRGEFVTNGISYQQPIFITQPNGYIKELNDKNLNYNKNEFERKKFRHYQENIVLKKTVSQNLNIILSMTLVKKLNSFR